MNRTAQQMLLIALLLALSGCPAAPTPPKLLVVPPPPIAPPAIPPSDEDLLNGGRPQEGLPLISISVGGHAVEVEVAATDLARQTGLMYRPALAPERGMLFVYSSTAPRGFWMKNTQIPLSIAYIGEDGAIVDLQEMEPSTAERPPSYPSKAPCRYALEMSRGWFKAKNLALGTRIEGLAQVQALD